MNNKKKILLVEDEASLRNILKVKFDQLGVTILEAKDGEEGLKLSLSEHPDLIILDVLMPKLNGIGMLKQLRQDPWGKNARVIVLTNVEPSEDEIVREVTTLNPEYYLVKSDQSLLNLSQIIEDELKQ